MRTLALAVIVFAALPFGADKAEAAPWCAHYNTGLNDCGFHSHAQCTAAVSGVGGVCARNLQENYSWDGAPRRRYR